MQSQLRWELRLAWAVGYQSYEVPVGICWNCDGEFRTVRVGRPLLKIIYQSLHVTRTVRPLMVKGILELAVWMTKDPDLSVPTAIVEPCIRMNKAALSQSIMNCGDCKRLVCHLEFLLHPS
jgi:hypothetical protein